MSARVIVLAGPSGSGKSRVAARVGLPVLRLDDFYRSGGDPSLPVIAEGANAGLVDWDHPDSWLPDEAVAALTALCRSGRAEVPVYELAANGRTGSRLLELEGADLVLAEGIFAPEVVGRLETAGLLAAALCLRRPASLTFVLRLVRDLREHRKPPLVLVRRGLALARAQRGVVDAAVAAGCQPVTLRQAVAAVERLRRAVDA